MLQEQTSCFHRLKPQSKAAFLYFLLSLLPLFAGAQSSVITPKDSLEILHTLYQKEYQANPEQGLSLALKTLRIATKLQDKNWQAKAMLQSGSSYQALRQLDSAKVKLAAAAALYKNLNNTKSYAESIITLGEVLLVNQEFTQAVAHFNEATKLVHDDKPLLRRTVNDLGVAHGLLGKHREAINYFKQALAILEDLGDLPAKSKCYNNLGSMYVELKEHEQALQYYKASLEIQKTLAQAGLSTPNNDGLVDAYWQLGRTYTILGNYPEAKKHLDLAIGRAKKVGDKYKEIGATWYLADFYSHQKKYEEAIALVKSTEGMIAANKFDWLYREYYERVADQYKLAGKEKESLEYKEKYVAVTDSLLKQKELETMTLAKGTEKDSLKLKTADSPIFHRLKAAEKTKYWWALFGATLFICSTYMLWRYRKKLPGTEDEYAAVAEAQPAPEPAFEATEPAQPLVLTPAVKYVQAVKQSGEVIVPIENIYWFETKEKKYYLCDGEELLETHHTIAELESMLGSNENFIRINRSVIINAHFMFNYSPWEKDKYIVRMQDKAKTEFSMPRNRMKAMRQQFGLEAAVV